MSLKTLFQPKYMSYSAQEFAKDNDIYYTPTRVRELRILELEKSNNFLRLTKDGCIILHPPNDGMPTRPVEFFRRAKGGKLVKVIDNRNAFCEITNLPEILLQIAVLYEKHIDEPIFLDPMCFAIMLIDPINKHYVGRGKLAIAADTLCNNNVKPKNQEDARKFFYNRFLDHFIGWNFGKAVSKYPQLEDALSRITRQLIDRDLRRNAGPGFNVWISKDVWHVEYTDAGDPKIIRY